MQSLLRQAILDLRVFVPSQLRSRLHAGDATLLFTHLVVREDGWFLYGFDFAADRDLFVLLLGADGVGPRTAMAVMSGTSIEILQRAVYGEDPDLLGHIPGVGRKTAQKILIHLKDRLKPVDALHAVAALSDADGEVLAASNNSRIFGDRGADCHPIHPKGCSQ